MEIVTNSIESYIDDLLPGPDEVLGEMEAFAAKSDFPIVGPQVGRLLYQFAAVHKPKHVFEMGSGFGYSAYWILKGARGATMICTETSPANVERGAAWLDRAGVGDRVTYLHAKAQDALRKMGGTYDLIFNDVNKEQYPEAFGLAMAHLADGGLLITDNVLWRGDVTDDAVTDRATAGVREYNRLMFNTDGVFSTILPIRDGIGVSLKTAQPS